MTADSLPVPPPSSPPPATVDLLPKEIGLDGVCEIKLSAETPDGRHFRVTFTCCPNPFCPCQKLQVECQRLPETADKALKPGAPLRFALDAATHAVSPAGGQPEHDAQAGCSLGQEIAGAMTVVDWCSLSLLLGAMKEYAITADAIGTYIDSLPDAVVPHLLKDSPDSVYFDDIFPLMEQWHVVLGARLLLALDCYSVFGQEPPAQATVYFLDTAPSSAQDDSQEPKPVAAIEVDYKTGQYRDVSASPDANAAVVSFLMAALQQLVPAFLTRLQLRHCLLQGVVNMKRAANLTWQETTSCDNEETPADVGRNAPCPCGSGKKYKKCCGR